MENNLLTWQPRSQRRNQDYRSTAARPEALAPPDHGAAALEAGPVPYAVQLMSEAIQDAIVEAFRDAECIAPLDAMTAQIYCLGLTVAAMDADGDTQAARRTLATAIRGLRRVVRGSRQLLTVAEGGA